MRSKLILLSFILIITQNIFGNETAKKWYLLHKQATKTNYLDTEKEFEKIIKRNKNNEYAFYERALFYYKFHKDSLSHLDISKAIELNPSKQLFYLFRAFVLTEFGKSEQAINDINKLDKTDFETNYLYGKYFLSIDSLELAFEYFNQAIKIIEQNHAPLFITIDNCYRNRGKLYYAMKQYENAIQDYTIALSKSPDKKKDNLYMHRANVYLAVNDKEKSLIDIGSAFALNPDSLTLGYLYALKGDKENTEKIINTFLSKDLNQSCCKSGNRFYNIACFYSILNNKEKALESLEKSLQLGYNNFNWIQVDYDMKNIKNLPEFTQLILKYQTK
jgi:tetratricopeptide (TPR) repeat protein